MAAQQGDWVIILTNEYEIGLQNTEISIFSLSHALQKRYISRAVLHVYLQRPNTLQYSHQASIRVDVYERYLNGSVSIRL